MLVWPFGSCAKARGWVTAAALACQVLPSGMSWTHTDHTRALCRGTWLWPCSQSSDPSAQTHARLSQRAFSKLS